MSETNTTYLITGANKGIGLKLTAELLTRPNTTIIATVRDIGCYTEQTISTFVLAENSRIFPIHLDSASDTDFSVAINTIRSLGIAMIDIVIANAGNAMSYGPTPSTSLESLRSDFEVNALGPIKLFQATWPLLSKSEKPKFFLMSSSIGSITDLKNEAGHTPSLSYGMSKAAANYFTAKIAVEFPDLISVALHPGWVRTDMGQGFADAIGFKQPPLTLEESVEKLLFQVTLDTSGKFLSYDGAILEW